MEREELIQSARTLYNSPWPNDALKKALEENYPELKESEDERISKEIIGGLMWQRDFLDAKGPHDNNLILPGFTVNVGKLIAWLEKQKEQKPDIELIQRSWYMEGYHDREFGQEPKWIIKTEEDGPKYELNSKYGQPLTEQQVTEEQLHNLNEAIKSFRMDGFERIADSLHSLYNILKTQRAVPAEKSVKDKTIEDVISYLNDGVHFNSPIAEMKYRSNLTNQLKSLRSQPKQEWSEEDEKMIERLTRILELGSKGFHADYTKEGYAEAYSWLKSLRHQPKQEWVGATEEQIETIALHLDNIGNTAMAGILRNIHPQPHWKPSEEQMKSLAQAVGTFAAFEHLKADSKVLTSLYNNLKKLM